MDFVMRCANHEIRSQFPEAGACAEFVIPNEVSPRGLRTGTSHGVFRILELMYADDVVVFSQSLDELERIVTIYDNTFSRFGLQMSYKKTETMAFNVDEVIQSQTSLLSINNVEIKNVRQFRYLGHLISNTGKSSKFLHHRIASAYEKWNELKHVLTDREIHLNTRMKILIACVRSRLLYSVQAWELSSNELQKLNTVWNGFLRKMIAGGYARKNVPPQNLRKKGTDPANLVDGEIDWAFKISNSKLYALTQSQPIENFCHVQSLRYVAHICRMPNDAIQKKVLFDKRRSWRKIEETLGVSKQQALKTMMIKKDFERMLEIRFPPLSKQPRPRADRVPDGKH
ncbi:uncharacterized protein LOC131469792 [Solea solea]|uniref:uncharacterized protein LOC131469792 n=1 Tax=Solea solea TaxID=90069 RepID=UPI00272BD28C|nr:uncharacterized protein LOC131469792 [Solea solea]